MNAIVIYESMYGNTRRIAESIADGFGTAECSVMPVAQSSRRSLQGCNLVVAGGPTHIFGMSRPSSRRGAVTAAAKPGTKVTVEPDAIGPGLRELLFSIDGTGRAAAAFDTRIRGRFSGRASKKIGRLLRRRGFEVALAPESFFVTKDNELESSECARAREWGRQLRRRSS
jgi:hypothetical protein